MNGTDIPGATDRCLNLPNPQLEDQGVYTVVVSDDVTSVTSQPVTLTLFIPPLIVEQPQSQTVQMGETVTFSVTVANTATLPVGYRWRFRSEAGASRILETQVLDARTSSYTITNVQMDHAGTYWLTLTNPVSYQPGERSQEATLTVEP